MIQNINRGIALLDKMYGKNWVKSIALQELDQVNLNTCVIGQLFGGEKFYNDKVPNLNAACHHGFELPFGEDSDEEYEELTHLWRTRLIQLLKERERR